jgi:hypothetical protein
MLEIYSEVVRDLLGPKRDKKSGMNVREDPKIGFYGTVKNYLFLLNKKSNYFKS